MRVTRWLALGFIVLESCAGTPPKPEGLRPELLHAIDEMERMTRQLQAKEPGATTPQHPAASERHLYHSSRADIHERVRVVFSKPVDLQFDEGVRVEGRLRIQAIKEDGFTIELFQIPDACLTPLR